MTLHESTPEEREFERLKTIATMAALLEAGDRAWGVEREELRRPPIAYAERATKLWDAAAEAIGR